MPVRVTVLPLHKVGLELTAVTVGVVFTEIVTAALPEQLPNKASTV